MMDRPHNELLKSIRTYAKYLDGWKITQIDFFIGCDMIANKLTGRTAAVPRWAIFTLEGFQKGERPHIRTTAQVTGYEAHKQPGGAAADIIAQPLHGTQGGIFLNKEQIIAALVPVYNAAYDEHFRLTELFIQLLDEDRAYRAIARKAVQKSHFMDGVRTAAGALGITEAEFMMAAALQSGKGAKA